jgi:hypothetical protein
LITFERPSAARTALLLQDAHLDGSTVHVSSNVPLDGATTPPKDYQKAAHPVISQEDKPHTAVVAGSEPSLLLTPRDVLTDVQNTSRTATP